MLSRIKELLFTNRSAKQTIVKNTIWLSAGIISSKIIRAFVIIYAARVLGAEGYGVFSYAMSLAAFFSLFSDLGLSGVLTRELSRNPEKKSDYIATASVIKIIMTVASFLITIGLSPILVKIEAARPLIALAAFLVVFDTARMFIFGFTRARNKMELEGILTFITEACIALFAIGIFVFSPSPFLLSLAYAFGSGLGTIFVFLAIWKYARKIIGSFKKELVWPIVETSLAFAMVGIFGALMINTDSVILGFFKSAYDLGLYAVAQRPVQLLYILPAIIAVSIFPIVSHSAHNKKHEQSRKILEFSLIASLAIALPIAIGGIILAQPLMLLLFGAEYHGAVLCFQLLLSTVLFVFPGTVIGNAMLSYNMQKAFSLTAATGAIVNIVLDLLLIPRYGINGSAVATIITQIIANGINWYLLHERIPFSISTKLWRVIGASLVMTCVTIIAYFVNIPVLANVVISMVAYGTVLFALKEPMILHLKEIVFLNKNTNPL